MASTTLGIRAASHQSLKEIAELAGQSLQDALDQAIEDRRRSLYLEGVNADYAALSHKAMADLQKEHDVWDVTIFDGPEDG